MGGINALLLGRKTQSLGIMPAFKGAQNEDWRTEGNV